MPLRRVAFAALLAAALPAVPAAAQQDAADAPFTFVALGDMPYRIPDDYARFERLIDAINAAGPAFSIFVGDTKGGGVDCADAVLQRVRDAFDTFAAPLVYTPGDNEWTDCHRAAAGGWDPLERLARVRAMHFAEPQSLGAAPMPLTRQSDVDAEHPQMVENARWTHGGVLFATIHVVGSNNGFERTLPSVEEYFARNAANLDWIAAAFDRAEEENLDAIVFAFQAELMFELPPYDHRNSGFHDTLRALAEGAAAYGRPVLLVHGDTHEFIVDRPLLRPDGMGRLVNVYRLEVFGDPHIQAVEVTVDPADPAMFAFRPLIVPENQ